MLNLNSYRIEKDRIRENLNKYTRKAFESLPKLKNPNILDVGCGTGVPTIELARMSDGNVIGLDIDGKSLNLLRRKIDLYHEDEISHQTHTLNFLMHLEQSEVYPHSQIEDQIHTPIYLFSTGQQL